MTHEREAIYVPDYKPFYFNPNSMAFEVGLPDSRVSIKASEIEDIWDINHQTYESPTDNNPLTSETIVLPTFGQPIAMGSGRIVLNEIVKDEAKEREMKRTVREVMRDVYKESAPQVKIYKEKGEGDLWPFELVIYEDIKFVARTFGGCACLGPNEPQMHVFLPDSAYASQSLTFPFELGLHNADSPAQRKSLYAGVGALGWLTKQIADTKDASL